MSKKPTRSCTALTLAVVSIQSRIFMYFTLIIKYYNSFSLNQRLIQCAHKTRTVRLNGLVVSALEFELGDPGSNPWSRHNSIG